MSLFRLTTLAAGILWFTGSHAGAAGVPILRSLRFAGNQEISAAEIQRWIASRAGGAYSPQAIQNDLRSIQRQYRHQGFWRASARLGTVRFSPDSASVDVEMLISEGRPSIVSGIHITGLTAFPTEEALELFETHPGMPFRQPLFERDLQELLQRLDQRGWPFAECSVESVVAVRGSEADSVGVFVGVREGRKLTIDEVRIEGAHETDPAYILRESRLKYGEVYSPARVREAESRLRRLNIFSSVSEPELFLHDGRGGLLIRVREGNTNTFDGIVGYVPGATASEQGYLTGLVSFSMRNLFGTGRKLSFRWERETRASQELEVRYTEPWVFGLPLSVGGGFNQRQQDTAYVRRLFDFRADLLLSDRLTLGVLAGTESVIPSADTTIGRAYRSSAVTLGTDIAYDSRDDLVSPTEGIRYNADYHYGRKTAPPSASPGTLSIQRLGLDLEAYLSPFHRQVIALGLHGRQVTGDDLQEGELYRFGGTTTLRGYRENQFLGSRVAWTNLEYRFLVGRRTFFYGFYDEGYYYRPSLIDGVRESAEAFKYGVGVGVRIDTALGNMGVSFAFGEGDTFSTAKVHVALLSDF